MSDATGIPLQSISGTEDTEDPALLQRLHQTGRIIAAAGDEAAVGQALMDFAAGGGVDAARLLIFTDFVDSHPTTIEMREGWTIDSRPAQPYGTRLSPADYPILEYMDADSAVICQDVASDERVNEPTRRLMAASGLGSFATVPLTTGKHWLGALIIGRDTPSIYDDDLIFAWWTLAGQAAGSIQTARLFDQVQAALTEMEEHARRLAWLNDMGRDLTQAASVDEIFDITAVKTDQILPSDRVSVALLGSERDSFSVLALQGEEGAVPVGAQRPIKGSWIEKSVHEKRLVSVPKDHVAELGDVRSFLVAPLLVRGQVIGTLNVGSKRTNAYTPRDENHLVQIASLLSSALENKRLLEQAQQRLTDLETIQNTISALTATLSLNEAAAALLPHVASIVEADRVSMFAIEGKQVTRVGTYPVDEGDEAPIGQMIPLSSYPLTQQVIETRQPLALLADDPRLQEHARQAFKSAGVTANATIPLVGREGVLGTLAVSLRQPGRAFSERDLSLLQTLADQATIAFERIRLFEQTRRRNVQLRTAGEVSRAASGILEPDELIQETVDLVRERFNLYYVGLFLLDETGQWATLRAGTGKAGRVQLEQGHSLEVGGDSMIGWCIANVQARIALDVEEETTRFVNPLLPETRSEMALPLISRGQVIGAMTIQSTQRAAFSEEDTSILQTMADQLANAIQNARLFEERSQRSAELSVLFNVSQQLASGPLQPQEIAEIIVGQLFEKGDVECSLSLLDADRDTLRILTDVLVGDGEIVGWEKTGETFRLSDYPATARVMHTLQPLVVHTSAPDADPAELAYMREQGVETLAIIPLSAKGQAIGVMELESREVYHYTPERLNLIATLANQVAVALENASLFEQTNAALAETETLAQELGVLNELGQALATELNVEQVLEEAHQQASRLVDTSNFFIGLYNPEEDEIAFVLDTADSEIERQIVTISANEGLSGYVVRNREGLLLEDNVLARQKVLGIELIGQEAQSWLGVPLLLGDRVLGVMGVQSFTTPRAFDQHDRELMSAIASQTAIAIQNARLFEEMRIRAHREQQLSQIMAIISASEDLQANIPIITEHIREIAPVDALTLTSYTPGETEFTVLAVGVEPESGHFAAQGTRSPLEGTAPGWVIMRKEPWLDIDIRHYQPFAADRFLIAEGLVSRLLLPLKVGDRVIGTLNLASKQPAAFREEHLPILSQIADQLTLALVRASLLESTQAALDEIQATHRRYLGEEWEKFLAASKERVWGYLDGPEGLIPADEFWTPEIEQAVKTGQLTTVMHPDDGEEPSRRSALALPIRLRGQTIGVLDFYDEERLWTEDEKALVETLADQISLALENARLFEKTQRTAYRERLTGEIVRKIRAAGDVQRIVETAAQELGQALGVSRAHIRLADPMDGSLLPKEPERTSAPRQTATDAGRAGDPASENDAI